VTLVSSEGVSCREGAGELLFMDEYFEDNEDEDEEDKMIVMVLGSSSLLYLIYCLFNNICC
jgi:hypothetical protein